MSSPKDNWDDSSDEEETGEEYHEVQFVAEIKAAEEPDYYDREPDYDPNKHLPSRYEKEEYPSDDEDHPSEKHSLKKGDPPEEEEEEYSEYDDYDDELDNYDKKLGRYVSCR
jgi:hypothetical protein